MPRAWLGLFRGVAEIHCKGPPRGAPFLNPSRGLARGPLKAFLIKIQKVVATQVNISYDQNKLVVSYKYSTNNLLWDDIIFISYQLLMGEQGLIFWLIHKKRPPRGPLLHIFKKRQGRLTHKQLVWDKNYIISKKIVRTIWNHRLILII